MKQIKIALIQKKDIISVAVIVSKYNQETYHINKPISPDIIKRDGFGKKFDMVVAKADNRIIGFALWFQSYDIHWGITGAIIAEMYVLPEWRGKCVAVWLIARIAKIIIKKGWTFINSMAGEDNATAISLYWEK